MLEDLVVTRERLEHVQVFSWHSLLVNISIVGQEFAMYNSKRNNELDGEFHRFLQCTAQTGNNEGNMRFVSEISQSSAQTGTIDLLEDSLQSFTSDLFINLFPQS